MTEITAPAGETETRTEQRSVFVRRLVARGLGHVARVIDRGVGPALIVVEVILYLTHIGPAWLVQAAGWQAVAYVLAAYTAALAISGAAEYIRDMVDPDRWDGDVLFEIAHSLHDLRRDLDMGADIDDVRASLTSSRVIAELSDTVRTLSQHYAATGDEDEVQRLYAVVLHLRNADDNLDDGRLGAFDDTDSSTTEEH
ncbi:hypothetical protein [Streptomyces sp. NPDC004230]